VAVGSNVAVGNGVGVGVGAGRSALQPANQNKTNASDTLLYII
jgi:hypothetical protein